jgi:hypothetical protein
MQFDSEANLTPGKLRANYTLASKSCKNVIFMKNSKPEAQAGTKTIETSSIIVKNLENSGKAQNEPGKNLRNNADKDFSLKVARLQEELDSDELSLKLMSLKHLPDNERIHAELLVYENFVDRTVQLVRIKDSSLARALERGWNCFKAGSKARFEGFFEKTGSFSNEKKEIKNSSTQVSEDLFNDLQNIEIESYINSLHRVICGMNQMKIGKIIEKLQELHRNMRPADLPDLSQASEVIQIDFTDTLKSIHTHLKARVKAFDVEEMTQKIQSKDSATQTYISLEDFRYEEVYKVLILELENKLADISLKLRKKEDVEEKLIQKTKEWEELRRKYIDVKTTSCAQCRIKRGLLQSTNSHLRTLEMTVEKGFHIEKELIKAKQQLIESKNIILTKDKKIQDLSSNVEELVMKVKETKIMKEKLEGKLEKSTKELEKIIEVLENSEKHRNELEATLNEQTLINQALQARVQGVVDENYKLRLIDSSFSGFQGRNFDSRGTGFDGSPFIANNSQKNPRGERNYFHRTPPPKTADRGFLYSPDKKNRIIRNDLTGGFKEQSNDVKKFTSFKILNSSCQAGSSSTLKSVKQNILTWLNLSKEEYLAFNKKTRLELFECLFEHKEKCGADCEHLKRAMQIKQKSRGVLFPTKKYNIS